MGWSRPDKIYVDNNNVNANMREIFTRSFFYPIILDII